ncbi:MAG: hypothetical protein V8S98_05125 [Lachnospiraceae bacterium]
MIIGRDCWFGWLHRLSGKDSVYEQRGDAQWMTGKEVAKGAADGTVEGYYELQKQNFYQIWFGCGGSSSS